MSTSSYSGMKQPNVALPALSEEVCWFQPTSPSLPYLSPSISCWTRLAWHIRMLCFPSVTSHSPKLLTTFFHNVLEQDHKRASRGGMQAVTRFEVKGFIDCKPFSYKWSTWSKAGLALCRVQRGCSRLTHEMRNKTGSQFKQKNQTFLLCFYGCVERFCWEQVNTRYCEANEKVSRVKATSLSQIAFIAYLFVCQCCISVLQTRTHIHVMAYMAFNGL